MDRAPVVVVGGGIVGTAAAMFAAKQGFKVQLYESRGQLHSDSCTNRSINLTICYRGSEALKKIGCKERIENLLTSIKGRMIHSLKGRLTTQLYSTEGDKIYSVNRQKLNECLLEAAMKQPNIEVHFGHRLVDIREKEVVLKVDEKEIIQPFHFVLGCDGFRSQVRSCLALTQRMNCSQEFMEYGYKELRIPPSNTGDFVMDREYLHIWPRHEFMMIAIPNRDKSFNVILFMPIDNFEQIKTDDDVLNFFNKYFPDTLDKFDKLELFHDFRENSTSYLNSVKCFPHYFDTHVLLLGDAAHATVPFYGQGMNAGLEDCLILDECLQEVGGTDLHRAAQIYSKRRYQAVHALVDLSKANFLEMSSKVTSPFFLYRKQFDNLLYRLFPSVFKPLYPMVVFSRMPYHKAVEQYEWQQSVIKKIFLVLVVLVILIVCAIPFLVSFS